MLRSWGGAHAACVDFLDRWANEAAPLGWTTLEVFGVHPEGGAIVMSDVKVATVAANRIALVNTAYYCNMPGRPGGTVPLWAFGR